MSVSGRARGNWPEPVGRGADYPGKHTWSQAVGYFRDTSVALGLPAAAGLTRYVRASMQDVLRRDCVRTAVGKGLPHRLVIWKHALKNALVPVVTVLGLELRTLLGGAVAVEAVFALPGLGTMSVRAVNQGDYRIVQGVILLAIVVVVVINITIHASYAYLNPKVRIT
jgi:peptide/nickel transport system permease protein